MAPQAGEAIDAVLAMLDSGELRVAQRQGVGRWSVNGWVMRAAILSLCGRGAQVIRSGDLSFCDQRDKFHGMDDAAWHRKGWRVMPPSTVRRGSYLGQRAFLLPCFIGVGVYLDDDVMVDGFTNVGSCAQIGKRVHLSTCVAIGGVAEPMQARPVIIEDDCFIGAHSSVVEGVIVEQGSVIGMGVHLGASTKILDRETGQVSYGRIPSGAVVVPGSMPSADGSHAIACAVITKRVDAGTRSKVRFNAMFRS